MANAERIRKGMTLGEVAALLGRPGIEGGDDFSATREWRRGELPIRVRLDYAGRVYDREFSSPPPDSYLDYFRRMLP